MVRLELANQWCTIQCDTIEDHVCGVVGQSIIFAEVREELDLVSWGEGGTCLISQSPRTWMEFAFVLSYYGLPVFVTNCALVGDMCAIREDYRSGSGSVLGHVCTF